MKKLHLLSLLAVSACSSSSSYVREDGALPTALPGIPRSIGAHCREEATGLYDKNPDVLRNADAEGRACAELKAYEDCLARMERIAEGKNKSLRTDPFFSHFPGAWDHDLVADTLEAVSEHPACDGIRVTMQGLAAWNELRGKFGGTIQWENRGPGFSNSDPGVCPVN